jgi:FXSXX-COOH protein
MPQQVTDPRAELGPIDTSELRGSDLAGLSDSALMRALAEVVDPLRSPSDPRSGFGNNLSG